MYFTISNLSDATLHFFFNDKYFIGCPYGSIKFRAGQVEVFRQFMYHRPGKKGQSPTVRFIKRKNFGREELRQPGAFVSPGEISVTVTY